jgi:protein-disulfide isomerase
MDSKQTASIPGAIIVAGAIIAMAIIWTSKPAPQAVQNVPTESQPAAIVMAPVTNADHILGNPAAPIKIVEYSDSSCPFCKMFHPTMEQVIEEYGADGKVAWVYRHFPLDKPGSRSDGGILHPNAGHEAQAMECAAALGGNDAFWKFTNRLYEITPSVTPQTPNGLDQKQLPEIAKFAGLDAVSFNECLTSGRFTDKVESQYQDGLSAGVNGTPFSIIVTDSGQKIPITGAQPYSTLKTTLDALISEEKL